MALMGSAGQAKINAREWRGGILGGVAGRGLSLGGKGFMSITA